MRARLGAAAVVSGGACSRVAGLALAKPIYVVLYTIPYNYIYIYIYGIVYNTIYVVLYMVQYHIYGIVYNTIYMVLYTIPYIYIQYYIYGIVYNTIQYHIWYIYIYVYIYMYIIYIYGIVYNTIYMVLYTIQHISAVLYTIPYIWYCIQYHIYGIVYNTDIYIYIYIYIYIWRVGTRGARLCGVSSRRKSKIVYLYCMSLGAIILDSDYRLQGGSRGYSVILRLRMTLYYIGESNRGLSSMVMVCNKYSMVIRNDWTPAAL